MKTDWDGFGRTVAWSIFTITLMVGLFWWSAAISNVLSKDYPLSGLESGLAIFAVLFAIAIRPK
jgi:hypothetical protein